MSTFGEVTACKVIKGIEFSGIFKYGNDFTDAPEEKEFAWVELSEAYLYDRRIKPDVIPKDVMSELESIALAEAEDQLGIPN